METARNPELMREVMRNTDRAMSNIESLPEGFNMLRRMYENVQEPLQNIASMTGNHGTGPGSNPFAALVGNQIRGQIEDLSATPSTMGSDANSGSSVPNSSPLPNPWTTTAATRGTRTNSITRINRAGGANVTGNSDFGAPVLSGINSMSGGLIDPSRMIQLLQNPAVSQMMNQLVGMDPELHNMVDSNPEVQEPMQNPELLPSELASPERLQLQLFGTGQTGRGAVPPEELYANQLSQLQEMGFIDIGENIQALLATSGNVHAAVERLLQNLGQ